MKNNSRKKQLWLQLAVITGIIIAINIISSIYYQRIDLTNDHRYTLSEPTKKLVKGVNDIVFVKVYLEGKDMQRDMRRLRDATHEMLDEFRAIAGDKIQYEFIDPAAKKDAKERDEFYKILNGKGLQPVEVGEQDNESASERIYWPGAIISYGNREIAVQLMQQEVSSASTDDKNADQVNKSIIGLEYALANGIRKIFITDLNKPKIAFIQGHGELPEYRIKSIEDALKQYYRVDFVNLPEYKAAAYDTVQKKYVYRLDGYEAIIIAKPDSTFNEVEKYKIDQYIMRGGKVLWLIDPLFADLDSLKGGQEITHNYPLNIIDDLLFTYGVRLNYNLVQDLNCQYIPTISSAYGSQNKAELHKWPYYPVVTPSSDHPIVNNLNAIWFRFASTIDTLNGKHNINVQKTILLQTSPQTRIVLNPARISLDLIGNIDPKLYFHGPQNLAVLLEGSFESAYKNRIPPGEQKGAYGVYKDVSPYTSMIVVSDGDVIKNEVNFSKGIVYPLGFDPYTNATFGNQDFMLNCIDYLADKTGLITVRAKNIKIRLLDVAKVKDEKLYWQIMNMVVPILALAFFGIIYNYVRRRRFTD